MIIEYNDPIVTMPEKLLAEKLKAKEQEIFKSFLLRLIHCTDGSRYEEDMVDDYWGLICDMKREYKEKFGEEVE